MENNEYIKVRMALIFEEWHRRAIDQELKSENIHSFSSSEYGVWATKTFNEIAEQLSDDLPKGNDEITDLQRELYLS